MGGNDKSRLLLGGRPMLARVIDRMRPQVSLLAVSANDHATRTLYPNLPVLNDGEFRFEGPLAGVLAGVRWARRVAPSAVWLATAATDTPFLPPNLVRRLLGASDHATVTRLAASQGRVHPVFGLWPLALTPVLESWLAGGGSRKVHDWLQHVPHAVVAFDEVDGRDPFFNVNTPDDAAVARSLLAEIVSHLVSPNPG
jgi:molybdopterin-guanine dinucleotide biosynthesis protein A